MAILTIAGAVLPTHVISLHDLKGDALQLATHWARHVTAAIDNPDGAAPG